MIFENNKIYLIMLNDNCFLTFRNYKNNLIEKYKCILKIIITIPIIKYNLMSLKKLRLNFTLIVVI